MQADINNFHVLSSTQPLLSHQGKLHIPWARGWLNASVYMYVLAWPVIGRLMVSASSVPFAFTMSQIHFLFVYHQLAPSCAANWFIKNYAVCYDIYLIMHVKDPKLSAIRVGNQVPLTAFCLSLYSLHILNRDVNMI